MDKKNMHRTAGGLGLLSTIAVVLILLKVFNLIAWNWAQVLAPLWVPALLVVLVFGGILIAGRVKNGKW